MNKGNKNSIREYLYHNNNPYNNKNNSYNNVHNNLTS